MRTSEIIHIEGLERCLVHSECPVNYCVSCLRLIMKSKCMPSKNYGNSPALTALLANFSSTEWVWRGALGFALPSSPYMPGVVAFSWVKDPFKACALATFQNLLSHLMLNLAPRESHATTKEPNVISASRSRFHNSLRAKSITTNVIRPQSWQLF